MLENVSDGRDSVRFSTVPLQHDQSLFDNLWKVFHAYSTTSTTHRSIEVDIIDPLEQSILPPVSENDATEDGVLINTMGK